MTALRLRASDCGWDLNIVSEAYGNDDRMGETFTAGSGYGLE